MPQGSSFSCLLPSLPLPLLFPPVVTTGPGPCQYCYLSSFGNTAPYNSLYLPPSNTFISEAGSPRVQPNLGRSIEVSFPWWGRDFLSPLSPPPTPGSSPILACFSPICRGSWALPGVLPHMKTIKYSSLPLPRTQSRRQGREEMEKGFKGPR